MHGYCIEHRTRSDTHTLLSMSHAHIHTFTFSLWLPLSFTFFHAHARTLTHTCTHTYTRTETVDGNIRRITPGALPLGTRRRGYAHSASYLCHCSRGLSEYAYRSYTYVYIYIFICVYICIYIYIYLNEYICIYISNLSALRPPLPALVRSLECCLPSWRC